MTPSALVWIGIGPWKRVVATRSYARPDSPEPHSDSVESSIDYRVPPSKLDAVYEFDRNIGVDDTIGEVSTRGHSLQANLVKMNLVHDIVRGVKTPAHARSKYDAQLLKLLHGGRVEGVDVLKTSGDMSGEPKPVPTEAEAKLDDDSQS